MQLEVGKIYEGKVTGITKFGAFVEIDKDTTGMVHISEVANTFVNDVHDHVQIGQKVKVKVLSLGEAGKINLSIKRAAEAPRQNQPPRRPNPGGYQSAPRPAQQSAPAQGQVAAPTGDQDFEDRLKRFMQESDSRIADNRMYSERKQRSRRR